MKKYLINFGIVCISFSFAYAQQPKDKIEFREYKPGYYENSILKGIEEYEIKTEAPTPGKVLKVDLSGKDVPTSADQFTTIWKNTPISQGNAGTCWSFSTTSFFETEVNRLFKKEVKISEIFTAYWEYVEKAKRFIRERGNSHFDEGSEANGVIRIYKMYGAVPLEAYNGFVEGKTIHDHSKMVAEMKAYLASIKANNAWNEEEAINTIKSILNHYIGEPPTSFKVNGHLYTPKEYLKNELKLNMDDYFDLMSLMESPYWEKAEYKVEDNWWHSNEYYNVPLEVFMDVVKKSIKSGYSMMIGGDVSEAGFDAANNIAVVPTFDIPSEYIDENARQFRFSNHTTTDDHGMHLVGYMEKNGKIWYLIKDSSSGSRSCGKESKNFGFYFFSEDYVKLKMMDVLVHRDMVKDLIPKFKS